MPIYGIKLPLQDNAGRSTAFDIHDFASFVLDTVGGYTDAGEQCGVWRDDSGEVYRDTVHAFEVACNPEQWASIVAKAFECFPDQLAIYTANLGEAAIINRS